MEAIKAYRRPSKTERMIAQTSYDALTAALGQLKRDQVEIEIEETNGIKKIRYLKPIIIQPLCLNCHGSTEDINQNVKNVLNTRYPDDKATEYQTDDLRGAVSISKTL